MEPLESRVMLYGDHPGLTPPPGPGTVATVIGAFDPSGNAAVPGLIQSVGTGGPGGVVPAGGDNDVFTFTAPANDFVRVIAQTVDANGVASGLDSRVRVYNALGQILNSQGQFVDPATPGLQAAGDNNGIISTTRPNTAPDGWAGFIAVSGQQYFVQVLGQNGTTGSYTLRVGTTTTVITPDAQSGEIAVPPEIAPPPVVPYTPPIPEILFPEHELFWRITTPSDARFDSVATVTAASFRAPHLGLPPIPAAGPVDTHLEVYDSQGRLIVSDIESGFLNDAFLSWKAAPNSTYFIRARGDDLRDPAVFQSTGPFQIRVDMAAQDLDNPVNPITRRGSAFGGLADAAASVAFRFRAEGTGLTFITSQALPPPPHDVSIRVYDNSGNFIGFNDDFTPIGGTDAEVQIQLVGGNTYFVIVDGFDDASSGAFGLWVEAHHTFNQNQPIDDHVPIQPGTVPQVLRRREAEFATPIQFNGARLLVDSDGNVVRDRAYVAEGFADGRIYNTGDSDLFMFTPEVDMRGEYSGNNDDAGLALFVGGAFTVADPNAANFVPVTSRGVSPWDAGNFWFTGPQGPTGQPAPVDIFGFGDGNPLTDNPDIPNLPGTTTDQGGVIYAMQVWQPAGAAPFLVVGGDFSLVIPGPFGPEQHFNLAAWFFSPQQGKYVWAALGDTDAPVRALAVYDPVSFDPDGQDGPQGIVQDPAPESLVAGGDFTTIDGVAASRIARLPFDPLTGNLGPWTAMGAGVTGGSVRALAVFNPVDPGDRREFSAGPPALPLVTDTPDIPVSLFVGGNFTNAGGTPRANLALWNGLNWAGVASGTPTPNSTVNGPVNAMRVFDAADPDGGGVLPDPEPVLIIAGRFTNAGGVAANNIVSWGRKAVPPGANGAPPQPGDPNADPTQPVFQPRLLWETLPTQGGNGVAGANAEVFALTVWDPPDVAGSANPIPPQLVVGGQFATAGGAPAQNIAIYSGVAWAGLGAVNGPVRALTNMVGDAQEPGILRLFNDFPPANDPQEVLYAGGNFTIAGGVEAANVAQFAFDPAQGAFAWSPLNSGVNSPVFALTPFDDQNPTFDNSEALWDRNDRPAARVRIEVAPVDGSFLTPAIRVYDSDLNLVYQNAGRIYTAAEEPLDVVPIPQNTNPGSVDPSAATPGVPQNLQGPALWGGERYYIEVVSNGGTGRYQISVRLDAQPPDIDSNGTPDDVISFAREVADEGQFTQAANIVRQLDSGDGRVYTGGNILGDGTVLAYGRRVYRITPSYQVIIQENELSGIETIDDTDLYSFIAEETGTVQIRINTEDIGNDPSNDTQGQGDDEGDEFTEQQQDFQNQAPQVTTRQTQIRSYNSPLDAALRVFNNDFVEIGVDDFNPAVQGDLQTNFTGTFFRTFRHRDPMITLNVRRGEKYYIQVESSQRSLVGGPDEGKIDWRYATGSYELMVDAPGNLNFDDDHSEFFWTPIPIGLHDPFTPIITNDPPNGGGTVSGVIDNTLANPDDVDAFYFNTVAKGNVVVTLTPVAASTVQTSVRITSIQTQQVVATAANGLGQPATMTFNAEQGDLYLIEVDGVGAAEGGYTLAVQGQPFVDDFDNNALIPTPTPNGTFNGSQWSNATPLTVNRFFGTAVVNGRIEDAADTDVFVYNAEAWEIATITINSTSASLDPFVRVFEVGEDPLGENPLGTPVNPMFLQIGQNDDGAGIGNNSRVQFSMTPGRPYYFIVSGIEPEANFGNYTLTLQVAPTDDHPNLADRPVATQVPITYDALSGVGSGDRNGVIERDTDNDLFVFTAPATGGFFINVTTPNSLFAPKVEIRNSAGVLLTGTTANDGTFGSANVGATSGLISGQIYYVVVSPGTPSDPQETLTSGSYSVSVTTLPTDDHPDEGQFGAITTPDVIVLNSATGVGNGSGQIVPFSDSDLFRVASIASGQLVVQLSRPGTSLFDGQVVLYDSNGVEIARNSGDSATAVVSTTASAAGQVYYILVKPDTAATGPSLTGAYTLRVTGATGGGGGGGGGGGPDDHPNSGDFANASAVPLDSRTGLGSLSGVINFLGDNDLFTFLTPTYVDGRSGSVFLQVVTPSGGPLDASVRVFDQNFNEIRFDALGIPGATAATSFTTTGGRFYALVEQVGSNVGSYTLKVSTDPGTSYLYYPEGFAGSTINEFVPLVNANTFPVRILQAIAHYEFDPADPSAPRDQVLALTDAEKFLAPNSRGGFTVFTKDNPSASLVRIGRPYALEIVSDGPLGGTFSHYDFGVTVGESFSNRTSTIWTFAEAHRDAAKFRDFLVLFNPNDTAATVNITLTYTDGSVTAFTRTVDSFRRDGVNFTNDGSVNRDGVFAVKVESSVGIVAALSSYDFVNGRGDGWLGDANGGGTEGVIPAVSTGNGVESNLSIYNNNSTPATVTIRATYNRLDLPDLVRVLTVNANGRLSTTLSDLGLVSGQVAGLRYTSNVAVTVNALNYRNGDGDASVTATEAATTAVIGDAFVNPATAGVLYIEELGLYNPASVGANITITYLFTDGTTASQSVAVASEKFAFIRIDQQPAILNRVNPTAFSIRLDATTPFAASFTHYDLFLQGGWRALPGPVGLTLPIVSI